MLIVLCFVSYVHSFSKHVSPRARSVPAHFYVRGAWARTRCVASLCAWSLCSRSCPETPDKAEDIRNVQHQEVSPASDHEHFSTLFPVAFFVAARFSVQLVRISLINRSHSAGRSDGLRKTSWSPTHRSPAFQTDRSSLQRDQQRVNEGASAIKILPPSAVFLCSSFLFIELTGTKRSFIVSAFIYLITVKF